MPPGDASSARPIIHADAEYAFEQLINNIPIRPEGALESDDTYITCVEHWNNNLYIGTSVGELIHYVCLPPEEGQEQQPPTFIPASRTEPECSARTQGSSKRGASVEVRQILVLPAVNKACVLCGTTLTFYSLPELTPAFGGKIKQTDCNWVGGLDEDLDVESDDQSKGIVVVICLKQRLRLIRIGEQARKIRDIELPGCLNIRRRGDLACVADNEKYALIDVANQQKVDLFPISSSAAVRNDSPPPPASRSLAIQGRPHSASLSAQNAPKPIPQGLRAHDRIVSLGAQPLRPQIRASDTLPLPDRPYRNSLSLDSDEEQRPISSGEIKPLPRVPSPAQSAMSNDSQGLQGAASRPVSAMSNAIFPSSSLKSHIASVSSNEFLLTTGTSSSEPGVGLFVNHEGEVVRGTIEFDCYPESLIVDRCSSQARTQSLPGSDASGGRIMAVLRNDKKPFLHVQSWSDLEHSNKAQFDLPSGLDSCEDGRIRLFSVLTGSSIQVPEIVSLLALRRLDQEVPEADVQRESEEDRICSRFSFSTSSSIMFAKDNIWWIVSRPLLVRLDAQLDLALTTGEKLQVSCDNVKHVFNELRGREPADELDFHTYDYIRQRSAVLLLADLLLATEISSTTKSSALEVLVTSKIDPRIILQLIPEVEAEVKVGDSGIWIYNGLKESLQTVKNGIVARPTQSTSHDVLQVLKLFLFEWRRKKGFGSVADERHVFESVDAGLLQVLLTLDRESAPGPATAGSVRAELNEVVDRGVDGFDRATAILQQHRRLYVLSRLFQSRKMGSEVLSTWRRIIEGEQDNGCELIDGEADVRRYLTKIKDGRLVEEYGTWLANRNPTLGVQVFADESSRVKFSPDEALAILRAKAPNAVKAYLEHLVFDKHIVEHVNSLITFYLDTVLHELDTSEDARAVLTHSYDTYRALTPPKPTYEQFMTDNAIDAEWFHNRLSLLQLVGSSNNSNGSRSDSVSGTTYDLDNLSHRLEPYSNILVPEMIMLNSRRGHDSEALRLLTNGLGDYDTAIRYCLSGGANVFGSTSLSTQYPPDVASFSLSSQNPENSTVHPSLVARQATLFRSLLVNGLLCIPDPTERQLRTTEVLSRYATRFEIGDTLALIPDDWPVEALAGYIQSSLRRSGTTRRETEVVKAVCGAQNLKQVAAYVEKVERMGARVERDGGPDSAYHSMASY